MLIISIFLLVEERILLHSESHNEDSMVDSLQKTFFYFKWKAPSRDIKYIVPVQITSKCDPSENLQWKYF